MSKLRLAKAVIADINGDGISVNDYVEVALGKGGDAVDPAALRRMDRKRPKKTSNDV